MLSALETGVKGGLWFSLIDKVYNPGNLAAAARKVMRLIDAIDEHDDVDAVYSNADLPDDVAAELSKG